MKNIIKAELFRIRKLKSLKVLFVLLIAFTLVTNTAIMFFRNVGIVPVQITNLYEGENVLRLNVNRNTTFSIEVYESKGGIMYAIPDKAYSKGTHEVALEKPLQKGQTISINSEYASPKSFTVTARGEVTKNNDNMAALAQASTYNGVMFLELIVLVVAVIILAGDFTHKRLKNYIHFANNRTTILIAKFIATVISVFAFEIICHITSLLIAIPFFGLGSLSENLAIIPIIWTFKLLFICFQTAFVMLLAVLLSGGTAAITGLYYLRQIVVIPFFVILTTRLSTISTGFFKFVLDVAEIIVRYATQIGFAELIGMYTKDKVVHGVLTHLSLTTLMTIACITLAVVLFKKKDI